MRKVLVLIISFLALILLGSIVINLYSYFSVLHNDKAKVGLILNGNINDRSYSQSHYEGLKGALSESPSIKLICMENVGTGDDFFSNVDCLVKEGCRIIVANSYNYADCIQQVADKYPFVYFFHASGNIRQSNVTSYFGRMYQVRYLSGIVAGLQSVTGQIGYVASFPIDEVNRGINAFMLGVNSVNPDAKVFVEWSGSWLDEERNRKAAEILVKERNIDVIAMHTDSLAPLEVAKENNVWSIGYNFDNHELYESSCLTAAVWNWEKFYKVMIPKCLAGKLSGGFFWDGVETGIVRLTPITQNVRNRIVVQDALDASERRIGINNFDVFFGPIYDTEGNVRIPEGCCPTDDSLLNDNKWYVKGVVPGVF